MHHLKELAFAFIMMLVFSPCLVSLNNSTLYMATAYHWPVFMLYLNLNHSSPTSLKPQNETVLYFYFLLLVMSIQM